MEQPPLLQCVGCTLPCNFCLVLLRESSSTRAEANFNSSITKPAHYPSESKPQTAVYTMYKPTLYALIQAQEQESTFFKSSLLVKAGFVMEVVSRFLRIPSTQLFHFVFLRRGPCVAVVLSWHGIYQETARLIRRPPAFRHWTV